MFGLTNLRINADPRMDDSASQILTLHKYHDRIIVIRFIHRADEL